QSPPHWLCRSLYSAPHSCLFLVGCISSSHAIGTHRDRGLADVSIEQYVRVSKRQHVEYPSPNRKNTGTTEQDLLTNQKPEPHVRRLLSESATLATPLIICCTSVVSLSGWLLIFLVCHWNAERQRIGCGQVVQHVCALIRRHTTPRTYHSSHL
uniref:Optic atrophy 3 protein homolog n=1 Tax=Mesocestoides corti TaxID=53468 RepID=A0A5K3FFB0_MESCO